MNFADAIAQARTRYERARESADEILVDAMEETYKALTGYGFSDELKEQIMDAVRNNPGC